MRRLISIATSCALVVSLPGCATYPSMVDARPVSTAQYQTWNCSNLMAEQRRLGYDLQRVSNLQRQNANADAALLTVGLLVFWPALFGMAATNDRSEELARLKGQSDAIDSVLREGACRDVAPPITMAAASMSPVMPEPLDTPTPQSAPAMRYSSPSSGSAAASASTSQDATVLRAEAINRRADGQISAALRNCPPGREMRCASVVVEIQDKRNRELLLNSLNRLTEPRT